MKLPKIEKGRFTLLKADRNTGIMLNNDNSYYLNEGFNYYLIFDNMFDVEEYIRKSSDKKVEYLIHDHEGNYVKMIVKE